MRLYELAYCCRIYEGLETYDRATVGLRAATGPAVDPDNPDHIGPLFAWLRDWGCRQFKIKDEHIAHKSLLDWWTEWSDRLPSPVQTLDEIDDAALDGIADTYEDLRQRQGSWQQRRGGPVVRRFGPAGAAKALYAIRPNSCSPWDDPIRERFSLTATGEGYRQHLVRIRAELAQAVADLGPGGDASQLPALLGRAGASAVKLVDEHDWVRYTRGFEPPTAEVLGRWAAWAWAARD